MPLPQGESVNPPYIQPMRYRGLQGYSWLQPDELQALHDHLPDTGRYLEVGTANGVSAALLAEAKLDAKLLCVDTFVDEFCEPIAGQADSRIERWQRNARPNMCLWSGTLQDLILLTNLRDRFDLCLIDAGHTYEDCIRDLRSSVVTLKPDGLLAAHDYRDPAWPGIAQAVDQFCQETGFQIITIVSRLAIMQKALSQ